MRGRVALLALRHFGSHGGAPPAGAPFPPPPEGTLPNPPENAQYIYDPHYEYKGKLHEEAELLDPYAMAPDVDTHTVPARAARHLLYVLSGVATFATVLYVVMPTKPTTNRQADYAQLDKDYVWTKFASGQTPRNFRD